MMNEQAKQRNEEGAIYGNQVGGHGQIRQTKEGRLVKTSNAKEVQFYNYITNDVRSPKFLRTYTAKVFKLNHGNNKIEMEDVNKQFKKPCILDLKIGTRHYDNDATIEKVERMTKAALETTSAKAGIRIVGMQVYKGDNIIEKRDKIHGRRLAVDDLANEFIWYFRNATGRIRFDVLKNILHKVECLIAHMATFHEFNLYSSSLLVCYDATCDSDSDDGVVAEVKMIDFAHTVPINDNERKNVKNDGYEFGLRYLAQILKSVLALNCKITPS